VVLTASQRRFLKRLVRRPTAQQRQVTRARIVSVIQRKVLSPRTTAPSPMAWAIRSGLVALLAAQAIGVWMIVHGVSLMNADADPLTQSMSTYGGAGAMKVAHGVPMHAIQLFGALAWLLSFPA
jgi:hypothetical protein